MTRITEDRVGDWDSFSRVPVGYVDDRDLELRAPLEACVGVHPRGEERAQVRARVAIALWQISGEVGPCPSS